MGIRLLPWLLALVGLTIPMIATNGAAWPVVVPWLFVLGVIWVTKPLAQASRVQRVGIALASIPLLVLAATLFGLFLIPAAAAWTLIELVRPAAGPAPDQSKSG